ncbi:MAG: glycosyltransferase family 2 protein [Muribaculaceae bacterium]|nr:glycosyltransferase family 2 protein [Muribaculaceae bacterium]
MSHYAQISIVIPVFNRAGIVGRTLDSIAAQSLRPLNLILVDNNSSDNTLDILNLWKEKNETDEFKITILQEKKPGAAAARNCGLKIVKTPYVMFFDSDDTMSPSHIENITNTFITHPDAGIVGWDVTIHTFNGKSIKRRCHKNNVLFNHIFHGSLSTQRYAVRTDLINQVGGWNETTMAWDDYELGIRLLLQHPHIIHIENGEDVNVFRQTESITGTHYSANVAKWEHALNCCEKLLIDQQQAKLWIEIRRCILAGEYRKEKDFKNYHRLINEVLRRTENRYHKLFFKSVAIFISLGGRGTAILTRLFLTPKINK